MHQALPLSDVADISRLDSRPVRLGAGLQHESENDIEARLTASTVLVRLDSLLENDPSAHVLVRTLVNQLLRFCPHVHVSTGDPYLAEQCAELAVAIAGGVHESTITDVTESNADVVITVGTVSHVGPKHITVNSTGWVARIAANLAESVRLPWHREPANALGAMGAACLAAAETFLRLIGHVPAQRERELSLLSGQSGPLGAFDPGFPLSFPLPDLDGLLAGCGGVGNGWAAAISELPLAGDLLTVDREVVAPENWGAYALVCAGDFGTEKTQLIKRVLRRFDVTPHTEELDLFIPRITDWSLPLPSLVITGFDEALPRHAIQRLWPDTIVDMAAGGTTAQVHLWRAGQGGQCLVGAHTAPPDAVSYPARVAQQTGLRPGRITDAYNQPITEDDIAAAPAVHRSHLEAARRAGTLICGYITRASMGGTGGDFVGAAPFVNGLAGVVGASMVVQELLGVAPQSGFHWQYNFLSATARVLLMDCPEECECHAARFLPDRAR